MISTAVTFAYAIYATYQYSECAIQRIEVPVVALIVVSGVFIVIMSTTLMVIHSSSLLTNEVKFQIWLTLNSLDRIIQAFFIFREKKQVELRMLYSIAATIQTWCNRYGRLFTFKIFVSIYVLEFSILVGPTISANKMSPPNC